MLIRCVLHFRHGWWRDVRALLVVVPLVLGGCADGEVAHSDTPTVARPTALSLARPPAATPPATPASAAPTPTFVPTPAPLPVLLEVTYGGEDGLHIRHEPNQAIRATLLKGSKVTVRDHPRADGGFRWWPVRVEQGWMIDGPRDPAQPRWLRPANGTALVSGQLATVVYEGEDGLNLRREPGPTGSIIATLLRGSTVTLIGEPREVEGARWWPVQIPDGWIAEGPDDEATPRWLATVP
jgi:hypothetical protein